ncbi:hypothetical protein BJV82DRAFT_669011 [Fennellomyces sp. T-0311]|nr:hypothetical protein BJV82DRAFT_669011 [Fennellomyces sp. T-0311]
MNPELRRDTIVEVPSRHYQHQVMQNWFNDKENRNRQKANMQVIYDMIAPNTSNTPSFLEFTAYVVTTSLVHESLLEFNSHFHHTKHRQMLHSARDSFQTQLVNVICGVTPPTTPRDKPLYIHSTTERQRRRHRQRARRYAEEEFGWQRDHRPTIVAYGDAALSHMSGFAPLPHWGFSKKLARYALLIFIDEFHSSSHCSQGGEELQELHVERFVKSRYRMHRNDGSRSKKKMACKDDDGELQHPSHQRPEARLAAMDSHKSNVYGLKLCTNHGV